MLTNKKRWILPLSAGALCVLSLSSVTQALAQSLIPQTPTGALPANNPAAQLDPSLVNVPSMPEPKPSSATSTLSQESLDIEEGFDIQTGKIKVGSDVSQRSSTPSGTTLSEPNFGARTVIEAEPRKTPSIPGSISPQSVIGDDNRVQINNTSTYPWRTMTKLFVTFPNGQRTGCSGAIIASKYVLTAAHCIHDSSRGGWASRVEVVPGLNGTYKPYGSAYATYLRSYKGWTEDRNSNYDFALITLDRNIGNTTGWLGYGYYSSINGVTGNIGGYPGDKGGLSLYYHYGPISRSTSQRVSYQIDTAPGQSGSGVYRIRDQKRYVFAVHTNGAGSGSYNSGTRINSDKFDDLKRWIATGN
jgi:V8-like Glu-specific endopeptidase